MSHDELKAHIEKTYQTRFWGSDYSVTPLLVDTVFGDGKKLLFLMPMSTRPNYYVLRVDSNFDPDNGDVGENEEQLIGAIEEMFGNHEQEFGGREDEPDYVDWPAWHDGGYQYGFLREQPLLEAKAQPDQPSQEVQG